MPNDRLIDEFRMMLITSSIFVPFSLFWFANSQMYSWGYNQCDPALKIQGWMDCNQMQVSLLLLAFLLHSQISILISLSFALFRRP